MSKLKIVSVLAAAAMSLTACTQNSKPSNVSIKKPAPAPSIDDVASGQKVFEANCAICHRADGTGGKVTVEGKSLKAEDLTTGKIKAYSDERIIGYVMNGIEDEGMPAFKSKLSEGEMRDVVKYVRMLQVK